MTPLAGILGPLSAVRRRAVATLSGPLPNASLIFDASDGAWTDLAKTTPAGVGDPVAAWSDQSGNANDAVQPPTGTLPILATGPGGHPAIQWDGSSASLALTSSVVASGAFTVYAVGTRAASTNWTTLGSSTGYASLLIFGDNSVYSIDDAIGISSMGYTGADGSLACYWVRNDLATPFTFAATGEAAAALPVANGVSSTFGYLGARPAIGNYGAGKLSALFVYPVVHDAGEIAQMATYIQSRWGVSIP